MLDICIIGAGPSGMTAAITAARSNPNKRIGIFEKNETAGRKLLATGNGRCNLTNQNCPNVMDSLVFFDSIGLLTRIEEEGRVYPYSERASDVLKALLLEIMRLSVNLYTNKTVTAVHKQDEKFLVKCSDGEAIKTASILIATGGKAGPAFGCSGDGYRFAKNFGHTVTKTVPALTALECEGDFKNLKGVRAKCIVKLYREATLIAAESGEVQFTEDGLSGICIFNLSRQIKLPVGANVARAIAAYEILIDFVPELSEVDLTKELTRRVAENNFCRENLLLSIVNEKVSTDILKRTANHLKMAADFSAGSHEIEWISKTAKGWNVKVKGMKGWKNAQCTAGGVDLAEVDPQTMESKLVKGLYFTGEILDYDGPCGGYNLQNAWETGISAGRAVAK